MNKIVSTLLRLGNALFDDFGSRFEKKSVSYSAEFVKSRHLSRFNSGVALNGTKATDKKLALSHTICVAPSGGGKTSCLIIPSIISLSRMRSSMVINDIKGSEIYGMTSGYLKKVGYKIVRYDFRDPKSSEYFNPLELIKNESDIYFIALLIFSNSGSQSKSDPFWENSAIMTLSLLIRYLYRFTERQFLNMQNVFRLVERMAYDVKAVDRLFAKTGDEELLNSYKALIGMSEKTLASVVATLRSILRLWQDKEICATTSSNTFNFKELRDRPVAVYISTPLSDLNYTRTITALLFNSLFNFILSNKVNAKNRSVFFLMDEFSQYSFPEYSTTISTIRGMNAGMILCLQDEVALTARYGQYDAQIIKTNCSTRVYYPGQSNNTAKEISQLLGKQTMIVDGKERVRELLSVDEVRQFKKAIVFIKNEPPCKLTLVPHFKNIWLRAYTKLPQVPLPMKEVPIPALIPFE